MNIQNTLTLNDKITPVLKTIINSMHMTLNTMEMLNSASNKNINISSNISRARAELTQANNAIKNVANGMGGVSNGVNSVNNKSKEVKTSFDGWKGTLTGVYSGIQLVRQGLESVKQAASFSDSLTNVNARLGLINDGSQTLTELQQKIYSAAQNIRGEYVGMANSVAKLNMLAKDTFKSNEEAIFFVGQLNKQFKLSGASTMEATSAMYQLTQAMGAGKLQGDEFRSILENAPMLAQAIAKEMGVTVGQLKDMSSDGKITADIIKKAMISSAQATNEAFNKIPLSFSDIANKIKNSMAMAIMPINKAISDMLQSNDGKAFVNSLGYSLKILAVIIADVLKLVMKTGIFVQQNWGIIKPILVAISTALLAYALTQIPLLMVKIGEMVKMAVIGLTQINLKFILIAVVIGMLVYAMVNFGDKTVEVFGVIGGVIGVLLASIRNLIAFLWDGLVGLAEGISNIFRDLINLILAGVNKAIDGLNMIPKVDIKHVGTFNNPVDFSKAKMGYANLADAYSKGQEIGTNVGKFAVNGVQNIGNMINNALGLQNLKFEDLMTQQNDLFGSNGMATINEVKGDVKIKEEDIRLLRDVAEREAINKFSTLAPNIQVSFGDVRETADVEAVAGRIKTILREQIAVAAEGGHM